MYPHQENNFLPFRFEDAENEFVNSPINFPVIDTSESQQQSSTAPIQSGSSKENITIGAGRGRKQPLMDGPSKTFACGDCDRSFHRKEHLDRHRRSVHTQEKPFECQECGKKFSRSDNLSQHARTHESSAVVMGVLEDGELSADHPDSVSDGGMVLFKAAVSAQLWPFPSGK
jgi:C2H2 transcription facotor